MINTSPEVVEDLVSYGADFARNDDGSLAYTREELIHTTELFSMRM